MRMNRHLFIVMLAIISTLIPCSYASETIIDIPGLPAGAKSLVLVKIPAGHFSMGSDDFGWSYPSEVPPHRVDISYDFHIGKYEITQAQWRAIMGGWPGDAPSDNEGAGDDYPAYNISWQDCNNFIAELNKLGYGSFRLPSEAEWEYVCRAGSGTRWYYGDDASLLGNYAWYYGNNEPPGSKPVQGKLPNVWGLFDIAGNVFEWCEDDWHQSYSLAGRPDNGSAWQGNPRTSHRVIRSGGWGVNSIYSRSSARYGASLDLRKGLVGLRIAQSAEAAATPTPTNTATPTPTFVPQEIRISLPNLPAEAKPLVLVKIPTGNFMMGRYPSEQDGDSNEDPQHQVNFAYEFHMGKHEITQAQWQAVLNTTPWAGKDEVLDNQDCPAVWITWNDCQAFITELNKLGQGIFRLPSEAEWEYCCRAKTTLSLRFYWGDDPNYSMINSYAWSTKNAWSVGQKYAHVVGLMAPNAWGLYDMSGNVSEYCEDPYHSNYSGAGRPDDGSAWIDIGNGSRVSRGGNWNNAVTYCRSARRTQADSQYAHGQSLGFRIVRQMPDPTPTPTGTLTNTSTPTPTPVITLTPTPTLGPNEINIHLPYLPKDAKPLVLVKIPAGNYMMGCYPNEQDSRGSEVPQHQVNIGYDFYMGKYEITKAQWEAVINTTPWQGQPYNHYDLNNPAIYITWGDCQAFVTELNKLDQGTFRMPSEAEWEYACRAGTNTRFYWGEDPDYTQIDDYAWYEDNAWKKEKYAHVVGLKLPNLWGLYDMSGNVWEWCEDDWHGSYSGIGRPDNGSAWIDSPRGAYRMIRNGGWTSEDRDCRSASRNYRTDTDYSTYSLGMRVVRNAPYIPTPTPTGTIVNTNTPTPTPTLILEEITIPLANLTAGAKPLVFVRIPAGNFMMGNRPMDQGSDTNERPQHQVNIGYEFYMGRYEITKAQWEAVTNTTPWAGQDYVINHPDNPAVYVSRDDIIGAGGFLEQLNALGQGTFRLPSEAEWEYCCRAGTTTRFYWGDDPDLTQIGDYAWYYNGISSEPYVHIVGQKLPNAWGLFDMCGNVEEPCEDDWHDSYSGATRPDNGDAWLDIPWNRYRVNRSSSHTEEALRCRSARRHKGGLDGRSRTKGFRLVREVPYPQTPTPTPVAGTDEITISLASLPVGAKQLVLIKVPTGSFMMGRHPGEQNSYSQEDPQHQVNIGYQFYIGKYEITKAQWEAAIHTTPWVGQDYVLDDPDSPAVYTSWNDSQSFVTELNKLGQGTFRLPSEAEREYCCRSGTTTRFYWGDDLSHTLIGDYAWYVGNAWDVNEKYAHVVGLKLPNAWGLFDMSGNVWERCEDDWHDSYSGVARPDNGDAWMEFPRDSHRVTRGGAWNLPAQESRSANRLRNNRFSRTYSFGLRIVREAP
jgi:formylglycine-generating enzyme required for sulfatase activity